MKRFTDAVRKAIENENWYGALTTALTLPDVCGKLEDRVQGSQARYEAWWTEWMEPAYTSFRGPNRVRHVFLSGADCYALRCSYLHEGSGELGHQRARAVLDRFHFITPPRNGSIAHRNQVNDVLQLQVDLFSTDIADAVDRWAASVSTNCEIQTRMQALLVIHDSPNGVRF